MARRQHLHCRVLEGLALHVLAREAIMSLLDCDGSSITKPSLLGHCLIAMARP
jgi:hypothetical protein